MPNLNMLETQKSDACYPLVTMFTSLESDDYVLIAVRMQSTALMTFC